MAKQPRVERAGCWSRAAVVALVVLRACRLLGAAPQEPRGVYVMTGDPSTWHFRRDDQSPAQYWAGAATRAAAAERETAPRA